MYLLYLLEKQLFKLISYARTWIDIDMYISRANLFSPVWDYKFSAGTPSERCQV